MNVAVRAAHGTNGEIVILAAWCPTCREEAMPDYRGRCGFCERRIVNEERLLTKTLLDQIRDGTPPAAPTSQEDNMPCKSVGCPNEATATRGVYAGLCDDHRPARKPETNGNGAAGDSTARRILDLASLAREVDRAKAKVVKAQAGVAAAKREVESKQREFERQAREVLNAA